jgi:predicted nucleic acid-binding protein
MRTGAPFQLYLSDRLAEALATEAERRRLSKAAIVRICLDRGLRALRPLHQDPAVRLVGLGAGDGTREARTPPGRVSGAEVPGRMALPFDDQRREVFVDASYWARLSDASSAGHRVAATTYRRVLAERRTLVTTDWVVRDAFERIRATLGAARAASWLDRILSARRVTIAYVDERVLELALRAVDRASGTGRANSANRASTAGTPPGHGNASIRELAPLSLIDAVSLVVMRQRGIREALTSAPQTLARPASRPGI